MNCGFVKVAAASPKVQVADCFHNIQQIETLMREAAGKGVQLIAFPELSVTGYTCMDLFMQHTLLHSAEQALLQLVHNTKDTGVFAVVGMPLRVENRLLNAAVAFSRGEILGVVPKTYLPAQEERWFTSALELRQKEAFIGGNYYPLDNLLTFSSGASGDISAGIEIGESLCMPVPASSQLAMLGANIILNLSASNELSGKRLSRKQSVAQQSGRCISGYVYAASGYGESTTDMVFAGSSLIAENGVVLAEAERFSMENNMIISEIDIEYLMQERRKRPGFMKGISLFVPKEAMRLSFELPEPAPSFELVRRIDPRPFIPQESELSCHCEEVLKIQANGLAKRIEHSHAHTAVVGVSGGLDSTLALLVTTMAFDRLGISRDRVIGITMPGFGTTGRTYANAVNLIRLLGVSLREISIKEACVQHFRDIGHDIHIHDTTYENSQARERTQILMDIANQENGLVVGTGDLSELALGWATYNGDHMSMYGVNASVPKTLVKYLIKWVAQSQPDDAIRNTLLDIVETPISPELIPADDKGDIKQKTEDVVGPYELHDFFLYHFIRYGSSPAKIYFLAKNAFKEQYEPEAIRKWMYVFFHRFFRQQFKRSCLPDAPQAGVVSLSPRGSWQMPSDATPSAWLNEIEKLN